jgi:hypothetical protein
MYILKNVFSLNRKTLFLLIEAYVCLGWARLLVFMPFYKVAPSLGFQMQESTYELVPSAKSVVKNISHAIKIVSRHTFWDSKCLVKAIAAWKMLQRRNIECTLYLGTARDEAGQMIAHAWLRSGPFYITGVEQMGNYTVVGKFAGIIDEGKDQKELIDDSFRTDLASFSKEIKLLLFFMKMDGDETLLPQNEEIFTDIDWNLFLRLTKHHRIYPNIYLQIKKVDKKWIPQYVIDVLRRDYHKNTFQMLYLSREMEQISRLFTENDIRMLVLKGPVLAVDLYGDVSLRTSVDLDILVTLDDLNKVKKILLDIGYENEEFFTTELEAWKWRHHHLDYIHPQSGVKLEVHWRLNPGPGKEPGFNELWERRRTSSLTSYPVYYLGREDLFLFLGTHGARHGWSRLGWLLDIDKIVKQKPDLIMLYKLLRKYQCLHIGGQALILAANLLNTQIKEETKGLRVERRSGKLAQQALFYIKQMVNLHSIPVPDDVSRYHERHLFALMSKQQKFLFIMSFFYPYPMDVEILPLPKFLHFLYLPLRPILWAWRKARKHE